MGHVIAKTMWQPCQYYKVELLHSGSQKFVNTHE